MRRQTLLLLGIVMLLPGCGQETNNSNQPHVAQKPAPIDGARIAAADSEPGNWMSHGRTYGEQRYSPLTQINAESVGELGLAWYLEFPTRRGLEATPLVVDGVMYTSGPWNVIHALDATTGKTLWRYDPKVAMEQLRYTCCGISNRGVAVWQGKVYGGTIDGRLIAVDAESGELAWEVQTTDPSQPYSITGAPRVVNGKVIIGNSGAEFGVRGYVTAYDAGTGDQVWRFYTVPGNPADGFESPAMEMAARTWSGEWWRYGGGGTAWDSFAFDPALNLLYIGTGNGGPWSRHARSAGKGDNLFLSSIVAVNADSGEYVWHYQTTPGDSWDYTATQHMILADLEIDGVERKVLMQAPKNGFFYVLDRASGELISANNFVPVNWTTHIDMESGRPALIPENYYPEKPVVLRPGPIGAHNWKSMSYHPGTGLVYIPVLETFFIYSNDKAFKYTPGVWNLGQAPELTEPPKNANGDTAGFPFGAHLAAWDPIAQKEVWRIPHKGLWNGGVLTTAGNLLFQGAADGNFSAYRVDSGERLWRMPVQTGIIAAPMSYTVNGEQYIAVNAGWGGTWSLIGGAKPVLDHPPANDRLLVFKLGGTRQLPPPPETATIPAPPALTASADQVKKGGVLYNNICYVCHGGGAISGATLPDLRHMAPASHSAFNDIVLGGALSANGMASFADILNEDDVEAIHAYLISRANQDWQP